MYTQGLANQAEINKMCHNLIFSKKFTGIIYKITGMLVKL